MTDLERNKALIRSHFDAIWSGDDASIRAQLAEDFVDHASPPGTLEGREAVVAWARGMRATFPDMRVTIDQAVAEGDRVAIAATWQATHQGPFLGIPATNRTIRFTGMVFWRIVDGRIRERWATLDMATVMRQLQGDGAL